MMTNEAKHLPGPWRVAPAADYADGINVDAGTRGYVCLVGHDGDEQAKANARLIAAAPDLVEALLEIRKGEGRFSVDHKQHAINTIEDMKALAESALRKAGAL